MLTAEFEISTDQTRLDVAMVHEFLRTSYWAEGRSRETVERSIRNSLCFGVYTAGRQIAFARVVTDRAVFAYLADVFVLPEFRSRGIAKAMMRTILAHADLQTLRTFLLGTRDAHQLYAQFGFEPIPEPHRLMGRYATPDQARSDGRIYIRRREQPTRNIRWGWVLLGGVLAEFAVVVLVAPFALLSGQDNLGYVAPPASFVGSLVVGLWVARKAPHRELLHGTLLGIVSMLAYAGIPIAQGFRFAYLAASVLKVVGGAAGGFIAHRRMSAKIP